MPEPLAPRARGQVSSAGPADTEYTATLQRELALARTELGEAQRARDAAQRESEQAANRLAALSLNNAAYREVNQRRERRDSSASKLSGRLSASAKESARASVRSSRRGKQLVASKEKPLGFFAWSLT